MKVLYVSSKYNLPFSLKKIDPKKLPKNIGLVTTAQHTNSLDTIKKYLKKYKKNVIVGKAHHLEKGQILGCNIEAATSIQNKVHAFLYIGSGKFHPLQLALTINKPIFIFNPLTQQFGCLDEKEIKKAKTKKKTAKIKFLSAEKIGILVSIKPGQEKLEQALKLRAKLKKEGKHPYIFLFDNFDSNQLENWPDMAWINTACPGLSLEQPLVWIDDL